MKDILEKLNKAFENKVRLSIMSALMVNRSMDFNTLKNLLDVTDGNLSSNMAVLEKLGYVEIKKTFIKRKSNTSYMLTDDGQKAFSNHIDALEALINGVLVQTNER